MTEESINIIKYQFVVDAKDTLQYAEDLREAIELVKVQMKETSDGIAVSSGEIERNLSVLAKSLEKTAEKQAKISLGDLFEDEDGKEKVDEALKMYKTAVQQAKTELVKEYSAMEKEITSTQKAGQQERIQSQKEHQQIVLQGTKERFAAEMSLYKENLNSYRETQKQKREIAREGVTDEKELVEVAKEQSKEAADAAKQANEEYIKAIEAKKQAAIEAEQAGSAASRKELEEAKRTEEMAKQKSQAYKRVANDAQREFKKIETAAKRSSGGFKIFGKELGNVGNIAKYVFGSLLGVTAISALRNIIRFFQRAAEEAIAFGKAQFVLELAVRNMRRFGSDVDLSALQEQIRLVREEYSMFAEVDITTAFAEATNKLSNFGFTAEQITDIVRTGIIVYVTDLTGRFNNLGTAINGVTNYLVSGYGEALERSGFIAGRAGDKLKAFEEGLVGGLYQLDPLTLAQTRYNLILDQTAAKADDAAIFINTMAGQMQEAEARITDATVAIGEHWEVMLVGMKSAWATFLEGLDPVLEFIIGDLDVINTQAQVQNLAQEWLYLSERIQELSEEDVFSDDQIAELENAQKQVLELEKIVQHLIDEEVFELYSMELQETMETLATAGRDFVPLSAEIMEKATSLETEQFAEWLERDLKLKLGEIFRDTQEVGAPIIDIESGEIARAATNLYDDLIKLELDYEKRKESIRIDHHRRLEDLEIEHAKRMLEITSDLEESTTKVTKDATADATDELARYAVKVAQLNRQTAIRRAEIERNYRMKEKQAERDFQEEMRRLREGFLFDLEDALRERDALQVIRLTRQYTLQKEQSGRQFELDKLDRKEAYQEELKQLAIQKAERLRSLAEELQLRLNTIAEERQAEIDLEEKAGEEKEKAEQHRYEAAKIQEDLRFRRDLEDLSGHITSRVAALASELGQEYDITSEWIDRLVKYYDDNIGEDGIIDAAFNHFISKLRDVAAEASGANLVFPGAFPEDGAKPPEEFGPFLDPLLQEFGSEFTLPEAPDTEEIISALEELYADMGTAKEEGIADLEDVDEDYWDDLRTKLDDEIYPTDLTAQDEWLQAKLDIFNEKYPLLAETFSSIILLIEESAVNMWGENSPITEAFKFFYQRLRELVKAVREAMGAIRGAMGAMSGFSGADSKPPKQYFAEGGSMLAMTPTTAVFGEKEPEFVEFTPVSKMGSSNISDSMDGRNPTTATTLAGTDMNNKISLEMLLSPDLEAKIIENTLGEAADIVFEVVSSRRH